MNFNNKRTKRITSIIIIVVVVAMLVTGIFYGAY